MGSPISELGRYECDGCYNETQYKITLTKPFLIGKFPITNIQYDEFARVNTNHPVKNINWYKAIEYCAMLNKKLAIYLPQNYKIDLPDEFQWEYACRAGTTTALNNDRDLTNNVGICRNLDQVGWYKSNSSMQTHPVGIKNPNN